MSHQPYQVGSLVIYCKTKHGLRPGPRARNVTPAEAGDDYSYRVDKFWVVAAAGKGTLTIKTRRGKTHTLSAADPNLRPARWWERWLYKKRFPDLASAGDTQEIQRTGPFEAVQERK